MTLLALLVSLLPVYAQELDNAVPVPPGVRYEAATEAEDKAARDRFQQILEGAKQVPAPVMLGPLLTQRLGPFEREEAVPASYQIPRLKGAIESKGLVLRGEGAPEELTSKLVDLLGPKPKLRRPTLTEMKYYWALAPFDLEGSIYVYETEDFTLFWNFIGDGLSYFEEVTEIGDTLESAYEKLGELPDTVLEPEVQPNFIAALESNAPLPQPLENIDSINSSSLILLTPEQYLQGRITVESLTRYLKPLMAHSKECAEKYNLRQCFVQVDLRAGQAPVLRVGGRPELPPEAEAELLKQLKELPQPEVRGPVCLFSIECP